MTSEAVLWRACERKSAYATQKDAEMGIPHFQSKESNSAHKLKAYQCEVESATHWHLGRLRVDEL